METDSMTKQTLAVICIVIAVIAGIAGYMLAPKGLEETDVGVAYDTGYDEGYDEGIEKGEFPKGILKIGIVGPMTGVLASEGKDFLDGIEWAVEEINEMGGIIGYKVKLIKGDTEDFEAAKITSLFEKLINDDKVQAIITGYGNPSQVEYEICAKYDMIYFHGGEWMTTTDKWDENPGAYKTCFSGCSSYMPYRWHFPQTFQKWIDAGKLEVINKKVAIVYSDNYYSSWIADGLRETFGDLGWTTTLWEMVPFGTVTEWGPIIAKIRAEPPGLVINTDYIPANEAAFVEQFLENPTQSHLFIQYAPHTPEFVDILGDKCTGIFYNSPNIGVYTSGNIVGAEMLERATERLGYEPGGYVYSTYNFMYIYKMGLEYAHSAYGAEPEDRLLISEAIALRSGWMGIGYPMVFDEYQCVGEQYATPVIFQLWEGERFTLDPEHLANAQPRTAPWLTD